MPGDSESKSYKYVRIDRGLYVCLHQNLAVLPWLIYLKGKPLGLRPKNLAETFKSVRRFLGWGKRLARSALPFRNEDLILELPFYGHLCLEVHRGYKVFDLRRDTVVKLFEPEVDASIVLMEIERARTVSLYDFAPSVRRWSVAERWYEEEYVNGDPVITYTNGYPVTSSDPTNFLETYYQYLSPCLEKLILAQPARRLNVTEYLSTLLDITSEMISKNSSDKDKSLHVSRFVDSVEEKLHNYKDYEVYIVLSHGDFGNNHVMANDHGIKIIDWEYLSHRSILFDLYSCLFEQLFFNRRVHDFNKQLNDAVSLLKVNLAPKTPAIANDLFDLAQVYRWIFYIEQICSGVEYSFTIMNGKIKWINAFNRFEGTQTCSHSYA
jgi:hypothetical protein